MPKINRKKKHTPVLYFSSPFYFFVGLFNFLLKLCSGSWEGTETLRLRVQRDFTRQSCSQVLTRDSVTVAVDGVIYFSVKNALRVVTVVSDYR